MKTPHLLPILALAGCTHAQTVTQDPAPITLPASPGEMATSSLIPPVLKAYPVGRYEDPTNPFVLHEAHTIYREEATPRWNMSLQAPSSFSLTQPVALTAELEQKIREQNDLLRITAEQNDRLAEEIKALQSRQAILPIPPVTPPPPPPPAEPPAPSPVPKPTVWQRCWAFFFTPSTPSNPKK